MFSTVLELSVAAGLIAFGTRTLELWRHTKHPFTHQEGFRTCYEIRSCFFRFSEESLRLVRLGLPNVSVLRPSMFAFHFYRLVVIVPGRHFAKLRLTYLLFDIYLYAYMCSNWFVMRETLQRMLRIMKSHLISSRRLPILVDESYASVDYIGCQVKRASPNESIC